MNRCLKLSLRRDLLQRHSLILSYNQEDLHSTDHDSFPGNQTHSKTPETKGQWWSNTENTTTFHFYSTNYIHSSLIRHKFYKQVSIWCKGSIYVNSEVKRIHVQLLVKLKADRINGSNKKRQSALLYSCQTVSEDVHLNKIMSKHWDVKEIHLTALTWPA